MKKVDSSINKFYSRQIKISEIGDIGQTKIMNSALLVSIYDNISSFTFFLCASIGFGDLFLQNSEDYKNNMESRNPILEVREIEDLDLKKLERLYVIGNNEKILSTSNRDIFWVNLKKEGTVVKVKFSTQFEFWKHDVNNTVVGKMVACILVAEITKHIINDEKYKESRIILPEEMIV